jgi:hypothetical protein
MTREERQLIELYLPLSIMQARGKRAFQIFAALVGKTKGIFDGTPLTARQLDLWVRWVEEVFIPMNTQMIQHIVAKLELLDRVPRCFVLLKAHNEDLKQELERWKAEGGAWRHPNNFPVEVEKHIMDEVGRLSVEIEWLEKLPT